MSYCTRIAALATVSLLAVACSPGGSSIGTITSKDTYAPSVGGSPLADFHDPYWETVNLRTGFNTIDIPLWSDDVGPISLTLMLSRDEADSTNYGLPMGGGWQIWLGYPDQLIVKASDTLIASTPYGSTTYVSNGGSNGVFFATPNDNTIITLQTPTGATPYYQLVDRRSNIQLVYPITGSVNRLASISHFFSTNSVGITRDSSTGLITGVKLQPTGHAVTVNYTSSSVSATSTFLTNGPSMAATASINGATLTVTSPGQTAGSTLVDTYFLDGAGGRVIGAQMAGTNYHTSVSLNSDGTVGGINVDDNLGSGNAQLATFCRDSSSATTKVLLPLGLQQVFTFATVNGSNNSYLQTHIHDNSTRDEYSFDSYGRVTQAAYVDSADHVMSNLSYVYDPSCNIVTTITDNVPSPAKTLMNVASLDGDCFPIQTTDQYGRCLREQHDTKGRLTSAKYGAGCTDGTVMTSVTNTYHDDDSDQSFTATHYYNGVAQFTETYWTDWSPQQHTPAVGGWSTKVSQLAPDLLPTTITTQFMPVGATNALSTAVTFGYDDLTRAPVSFSSASTPSTTLSINAIGWPTGASNARGPTTHTMYNDNGTIANQTVGPSRMDHTYDHYSRYIGSTINGTPVTSLSPGLPSAPTTCQ